MRLAGSFLTKEFIKHKTSWTRFKTARQDTHMHLYEKKRNFIVLTEFFIIMFFSVIFSFDFNFNIEICLHLLKSVFKCMYVHSMCTLF